MFTSVIPTGILIPFSVIVRVTDKIFYEERYLPYGILLRKLKNWDDCTMGFLPSIRNL